MNIPADLRYSSDHEWVRHEGDTVTIGITDYAQDSLGDVVFVELPDVGTEVEANESFTEVESTKSVSDIYAPVAGTITAVDEAGDFLFDTLGRTGDATGTEDEPSLFAYLHAAEHGVRSGRDSTPLHGTELTGPWGLAWTTVAENGWLLCVRVEGEE